MRRGLLDDVQDHHADAGYLLTPVAATRLVRQAEPGEYLVGPVTLLLVIAEHLCRRTITGEGHRRVIRWPALIPRQVGVLRSDHLLEPVPLRVAQVLHHASDRPARRNDRRMPGLLGQPPDDGSHRGPLVLKTFKKFTPDVVVSHLRLLAALS